MTEATTLAAGAAIGRPPADPAEDAEVLLVHRPTYDDWSLPKGKSDADEHILLTAVREVWEETCVRPVLGPRLPTVEYISWGRPKQVSYWSSFSGGHQAAPGNEIDAVSWLPLGQAREQLAGTHDDPVISALRPLETVPLILVRHASAGRKADWSGDDCLRPLDAAGVAAARVLASLMACFAPAARVISSPALRCTDTVRPSAAGAGQPDGLLRARRAGGQLADAALHRYRTPVRGRVFWDGRDRALPGPVRPVDGFFIPNGPG